MVDLLTPFKHKDSHKDSGNDAFSKGDVIYGATRYIEDVSDPASDSKRMWIEDATSNLKFWSDEGSPVKRIVQTLDQVQSPTNKTIDCGMIYPANPSGNKVKGSSGADNPFMNNPTGSLLQRTGLWDGRSNVGGTGLMAGASTGIGTATDIMDTTEGKAIQFATGGTANTNAGIRQTVALYRRDWSSYLIARVRPSVVTNLRMFIGFSSSNAEIAGEDPLNVLHGVGLGKRAADTTWQMIHNDGVGTGTFTSTGVTFTAATWVTIEMQIDGTNFQARVGGTAGTAQTTNIPGTTTALFFKAEVENAAASDMNMQISAMWSRTGT